MSADLVGSTAYKASTANKPAKSNESIPDWASTFKEFFRDFPTFVSQQYAPLRTKDNPQKLKPCPHEFKPWKYLGDEILFHVELEDHTEVPSHLWVFQKALASFPREWERKNIPLRLKGSAWLAGFPVTNREIEIETASGTTLDFIGPSLDLGFRLGKFADERRFILSADLGVMLLDALLHLEIDDEDDFRTVLHGNESLKGVIDNKPYPVVWLDLRDRQKDLEDELLGITRLHSHEKLRKYLTYFIEKNKPKLFRPFIEKDRDPKYHDIPEGILALREEMRSEESIRGYQPESLLDSSPATGEVHLPKAPDPDR